MPARKKTAISTVPAWKTALAGCPRKLTPQRMAMYCEYLAQHGRPMHAAESVGVTSTTIQDWRKKDPEFNQAVEEAKAAFLDRCWQHADKLAFEGVLQQTFDRNGAVISEKMEYAKDLLAMRLKKADPELRDRTAVDLTVHGGALVIPAVSPEQWEEQFLKQPVKKPGA